MTRQQLIDTIRSKQTFLCVGLDTDPTKVPKHLLEAYPDDIGAAILAFNAAIIDATNTYAVAYKINTAFYEAMGTSGWTLLQETIKQIPGDCLSILDAKRGDIGNTSDQYAKAFFNAMGADAVTVAPYMGADSVQPFLDHNGKWTIALALTSNPGSQDFQQLLLDNGQRLFEVVIERLCSWGNPDQLMLVAGATRGADLAIVRALAPDYFLLVPGVGAQGGSLDDVCEAAMTKDCCLLINSSRQIIYASAGPDFALAAKTEAQRLQQEMVQWLTKKY
jgi:orotidine-5'-phosphate decarboxylase